METRNRTSTRGWTKVSEQSKCTVKMRLALPHQSRYDNGSYRWHKALSSDSPFMSASPQRYRFIVQQSPISSHQTSVWPSCARGIFASIVWNLDILVADVQIPEHYGERGCKSKHHKLTHRALRAVAHSGTLQRAVGQDSTLLYTLGSFYPNWNGNGVITLFQLIWTAALFCELFSWFDMTR